MDFLFPTGLFLFFFLLPFSFFFSFKALMKSAKQLKQYKYRMKSHPTPSEKLCYLYLLHHGFQPKTQMILGFYIADIVIDDKMLLIEIDGSSHDQKQEYDQRRDSFLRGLGFKILHIRNEDVHNYDYAALHHLPSFHAWVANQARSRANVFRGHAISNVGSKKKLTKSYEENSRDPRRLRTPPSSPSSSGQCGHMSIHATPATSNLVIESKEKSNATHNSLKENEECTPS